MKDRPLTPGDKIGAYVLRRMLGEGAMGVVWLAVDPKSRREVAIKVLQPEFARDERMVGRFLREAQSAAKLNHPNTVAIYQAGESAGMVFIIMEWVDGGNLLDHLGPDERMPWPEATRVIRDAALGLMAAHEVGLIHRDIKPSNLMRTSQGVIKVVDFGLARPIDQRSNITLQGSLVGTPAYMSPEQCVGGELDARSDLYSLACTYYRLMSGEAPFGSEDIGKILYEHRHTPFPDIRRLVPDVPEAVARILERGTRKARADRFGTTAELIAELNAVLETQPASALQAFGDAPTAPPEGVRTAIPITPRELPPNNLPVQLTSFVGRRQEMAAVKQLLARAKLLTLTGPGGSGKTRLALEVAGELLESYPDGVWLVEFAALSDPALVPGRVAAALGVREEPGRPLVETLTSFLRKKSLLLVLDNCEHLRVVCAELAETLLRNCPEIQLLVSSREVLHVPGETAYGVPALSLPELKPAAGAKGDLATALIQFEVFRNCEAVQLFAERAASSQPQFALTDSNVVEVAHICRRLDGIPLAIELAAARVKMLTIQQIGSRLDDSIRLLTRGVETALPRQQTLRATMDWSHELLTDKERILFRRLAIFAGGFSLEAAEAVCAERGLIRDEILDLLSELADKSLISIAEVDEDHQTRYRLLETIRQYARERLQESTDVEDTRGQHREFFLQLAERAGAQLSGPQQARWLQRLEMEHDNFQVALDWALSSDVTLCARLAKALWRFWELRGHWKEGLLWLEQCLLETTLPANLRAATLDAAGNLSSLQGNYARAKTLFEEQLTLEQQLGDQRGVADALHNLMSVAWKHGDYETARKIEEHCLSIRRTLGDKSAIAGSLVALGTFAHEQGDYQRAGELYGEALALRRELGDESSIATLLNNMGNLAQAQGKTEQGRKLQEESLAIRRKVGDKAGIAQTLLNLAVLAQEQGEFARAQKLLDESLGIDRELGNKKGIAFSLRNYGELMQLQRDFKKAFGYYQQSVELFRELDDKLGVTACMEGFAVLAVLQNHVDRAARLFGAAEALRGVVGTNVPVSFESTEYNSRLATVRAELSDEAFAVASTEGQAMSVAEAISYALSKPEMNGNQ